MIILSGQISGNLFVSDSSFCFIRAVTVTILLLMLLSFGEAVFRISPESSTVFSSLSLSSPKSESLSPKCFILSKRLSRLKKNFLRTDDWRITFRMAINSSTLRTTPSAESFCRVGDMSGNLSKGIVLSERSFEKASVIWRFFSAVSLFVVGKMERTKRLPGSLLEKLAVASKSFVNSNWRPTPLNITMNTPSNYPKEWERQ